MDGVGRKTHARGLLAGLRYRGVYGGPATVTERGDGTKPATREVRSRPHREPRGADPAVAGLFAWYARVRPEFKVLAPGDLLASWQYEVTPVVWSIGDAPPEDMTAGEPDPVIQDESGECFVRPPLAQPEPGLDSVVVLTFDGAGIAVVTAREATHDRERALRLLPDGDDQAVASLRQLAAERFPSGRRDGISAWTGKPWRKSHDNAVIARALVARGLIELGSPHRAAIRAWLSWEHELGGEYGDHDVFDAVRLGQNRVRRPFEEKVALANRRMWKEIGSNFHPKV